MSSERRRYNNLDGIRSLAAIGVICMHVRANIGFEIRGGAVSNYVVNQLIASMGRFVQLFFILSAFSMCCGYYEKIRNGEISLNDFYSRRYRRILPFFALLVFLDLAVSLVFGGGISVGSLYEAFTDLTLMFGLFPASDITVIGVGWTLGVIFGFYILFPFYVFLIWSRKRAWFSLALTVAICYVCEVYFTVNGIAVRANSVHWICYFVAGGLCYLYRDEIGALYARLGRTWGTIAGLMLAIIGLYVALLLEIPELGALTTVISTLVRLAGFSLVPISAMGFETRIWNNPISRFVSGVSLEIYIAHMMIFRIIEKAGLTDIAGESLLPYAICCIGTVGGALIFAAAFQYVEKMVKFRCNKKRAGLMM